MSAERAAMAEFDRGRAGALLSRAVMEALAETAFLDARPVVLPVEAEARLEGAAIDILRPLSCSLEFYFSPEFGAKVADTLFEGGKAGDQEARDSVLELLNIAAGSFLSAYCGPGADIKLELPRFLPGGPEGGGEAICTADFDAEGLPLRALLRSVRYRY
jgi:hypothetical protein